LHAGEWTDDRRMALGLADGLSARGDLDESDLMRRFLRR
jgi:ADP-ribosylglycohydrolase